MPLQIDENNEYIIFCDESAKSGRYYSNFYGGLIVGSRDYQAVSARLEATKTALGFHGELKWSKVTDQYLDRYVDFVQAVFDEIDQGRIKVRIMFRHNAHGIPNLSDDEQELTYFRLYYQFVKHAFGLQYLRHPKERIRVRLYFDEFPETREKAAKFKGFLLGLNENSAFRRAGVEFNAENITEVRSHDHVLLQALDIILGSMCFRLNDMHKQKPVGAWQRGRRTIAKEKLYKMIVERVCRKRPYFNFGSTTGIDNNPGNHWAHSYRHWCFQAYQSVYDETRTKAATKKKSRPSDPT